MSKKVAIFVEGQTERIFVQELLKHLFGETYVEFKSFKGKYGRVAPRSFTEVHSSSPAGASELIAIIVDSSCDGRVAGDVRERKHDLFFKGFDLIVGLRDVYPKRNSEVATIKKDMLNAIGTTAIPLVLVFAIREIESWFIAEHTHFPRIDASLTETGIVAALHFSPRDVAAEGILEPSRTLDLIYALAGKNYSKTKADAETICAALEYEVLYCRQESVPEIGLLFEALESVF